MGLEKTQRSYIHCIDFFFFTILANTYYNILKNASINLVRNILEKNENNL